MNKIYFFYFFAVTFLSLRSATDLMSQDIHYSMFDHAHLNMNPAQIGAFEGNTRFGLQMRNQWGGVPVSYQQMSGAIDHKVEKKSGKLSPLNLGLLFNYDRAGYSQMTLANLGLGASYVMRINPRVDITIGGMVAGGQRAFDTKDVGFGDQYDPKGTLITSSENFNNFSKWYGDVSGGVNVRLHGTKRNVFNLGMGAHHLNQPNMNFDNVIEQKLPQRYSFNANGAITILPKADVVLRAMTQLQDPYQETVVGGSVLIHLNQVATRELAFMLGANYRLNDAFIPTVELHYNGWIIGASYDVNASGFKSVSNQRGGPELYIGYIITKVPPMEYCPLCPTYL